MSPDEPPFQNIAIVGFGLIGGSIALAIRERWPSIRITAVDRPAGARACGGERRDRSGGATRRRSWRRRPHHPRCACRTERAAASRGRRESSATDGVITDVGGTKRDIVNAACALSGARAAFVGGHPIGGAEQGGFAFARADLFRGRPWILTPNGHEPGAGRRSTGWLCGEPRCDGRRRWTPTSTIG